MSDDRLEKMGSFLLSAELHGHTQDVRGIAACPGAAAGDSLVLTCSRDATVRVWARGGDGSYATAAVRDWDFFFFFFFFFFVCVFHRPISFFFFYILFYPRQLTRHERSCFLNIKIFLSPQVLRGHEHFVSSVAFVPGNTLPALGGAAGVVAGCQDKTARIWDVSGVLASVASQASVTAKT
jgi:WD40 repeat protein